MVVLVVEDEVDIRELLEMYLSAEGHTVHLAGNGSEAWQWLSEPQNRCDVVIADIMMPVMGGRELLRRIRESGRTVPVLLVSGQINVSQEDAGQAGAWRIIHKPFQFRDVSEALAELKKPGGEGG